MNDNEATPSEPDLPAYISPYQDERARRGPGDFRVTLWASSESQRKRFEVFAEMLDLSGQRILDAGCGRGDFAAFLLKNKIRYKSFVGVDGLEDVITYANGRGLKKARFVTGDLVQDPQLLTTDSPDVVTISGTLNTMDLSTALTVLENAWAGAERTLAFNFLSDRTGAKAVPQAYPARRLDTMKLLDWAMAKTWHVRFRQDYFKYGHDATIVMGKV